MSSELESFEITKPCENLDEVFESDDFKKWIQIVLQESWYSEEEVKRIFIKIFWNTILPPEDEKELEEIFNRPIVQAKTKTLLRRLWRKLPENSSKFMKELLSDKSFNFFVDRIKRKVTTIIKTFWRSEIWWIEIEIYLEKLSKELWIWKLKFDKHNDLILVWEIWIALIDEDWNVTYNSWDLGIWNINETHWEYIICDLWIAKWKKDKWWKKEVITTWDLEIWKIESRGIISYFIEVIWEKWTLRINPETLGVEY